MKFYICIFLSLFLISIAHAGELRTWTGSNGKKIEAEFIDYDAEKEIVSIRLKNGKENRVKITLFSKEDQGFVKNQEKTDDPFGTENNVSNKVIHITMQLDEYGDGSVQVERTDQPMKNEFAGTPLNLRSLPKAKVLKGKDGIVQIEHDFSNPDDLGTVFMPVISKGGRQDNGRWTFRREFRLPMTATVDVIEPKGRDCGMINFRIGGLIALEMTFMDDDSCRLEAKHTKTKEQVFRDNSVSLNKKYERKFRLPVQSAKIMDRIHFQMEQNKIKSIDDAHTLISKIQLTGVLAPWIQIGTNNPNESPPFVKFINPRLTEESGLEIGDIIRSINGKKVENGKEMFQLFAECPIGEDIIMKIERKGKEKEVKIKTDK